MKGVTLLSSSTHAGRSLVRVRIAEESPFFEGHFAGEPVLPGVAHLALVQELLREHVDASLSILGIDVLRFRAPVVPRDELDVELRPRDSGRHVDFEIRRGESAVSGGVLLVG